MTDSRVLVAGATGQLGRVITRQLLDSGVKVRALGAQRRGARRVRAACRDRRGGHARPAEAHRGLSRRRPNRRHRQQQHGPGHEQPVPHRSRRLPEPLRRGAQHRRAPAGLRLVSRRRAGRAGRYLPHQVVHRGRHPPERHPVGDAAADRRSWTSGSTRSSAKGIREKGVATIFGDGSAVANYIAVEDVAEFAVKILARPEIVNEAIDIGGPSNLSQNDLATIVERRFKSRGKRRHIPVAAMRLLRADRQAVQRGCGADDDARPLLGDRGQAVSRMAGDRGAIRCRPAIGRDLRRADEGLACRAVAVAKAGRYLPSTLASSFFASAAGISRTKMLRKRTSDPCVCSSIEPVGSTGCVRSKKLSST